MNQQPVSYLQTDSRWKSISYSAKGESTTIGASGCGPTSLAMLLATWIDPTITPKTECAWALSHGWKCPHSGTYYGYFEAACQRFGLACQRLNTVSIYGNSNSSLHEAVRKALLDGKYVIACMGKGNWTSSGHYVTCWWVDSATIYINDPASTATRRTRGSWALFKSQVKYYWIITPPKKKTTVEQPKPAAVSVYAPTPTQPKEDDNTMAMTIEQFCEQCTPEQAAKLLLKAQKYLAATPEEDWSKQEGAFRQLRDEDTFKDEQPNRFVTRGELAAVIVRHDKARNVADV